MEKNEGRYYGPRINTMKNIITFLILFVFNSLYCQIEKDITIINQSDILTKVDTIYNDRTKPLIIIRLNKKDGAFLNGLNKIIIDDANYYVTKYKNGIEDNTVFNYIKKYKNNKLVELDIKGHLIIGQKYISIPKYHCESNIFIEAVTKEYLNDVIIEKITIYQTVKKNVVCWKIKYPNKSVVKLRFGKKQLNLCK